MTSLICTLLYQKTAIYVYSACLVLSPNLIGTLVCGVNYELISQ